MVDISVERLMLLPGTYDLTTSVYDHAIVHPFDFRQKVLRFQVDPGTPHESFGGVMSLDGQWSAAPGPARPRERRPMTDAGDRRRVVVATADTLTERMAGPAIRAWRIACELAARARRQAGVDEPGRHHPRPASRSLHVPKGRRLAALVEWCDVCVFQGWVMAGQACFDRTDRIFVVDVYDPLHLEQLEQGREVDEEGRWRARHRRHRRCSTTSCARATSSCAPARSSATCGWALWRRSVGSTRPPTTPTRASTRSSTWCRSASPTSPRCATGRAIKGVMPGVGPDDAVILWGGGVYNWFDPLTLIRAVDRLRGRRPDVRLVFLGMRHPNPLIPEMRMATAARRLADELGPDRAPT